MTQPSREDFNYHFKKPDEFSPTFLDDIVRLVKAGGSVNEKWVGHNIENAFLIGYVLYRETLAGCSVLKNPRPEYIRVVKEQAGLDLSGFLERGYTSVLPEFRGKGLGSTLLAGLTARIGDRKLYSVIGQDNIGGQKMARNNNTKQVAVYTSQITGKEVGIWIPQWMTDTSGETGDKG